MKAFLQLFLVCLLFYALIFFPYTCVRTVFYSFRVGSSFSREFGLFFRGMPFTLLVTSIGAFLTACFITLLAKFRQNE
jgi:hypothetical protein